MKNKIALVWYKVQVAALLASFLLLGACHSLTPAQQARLDLFECRARALAPVVAEVYPDVEALVRDLYTGRASLQSVLSALEMTADEAADLGESLQACDPQLPPGDAS